MDRPVGCGTGAEAPEADASGGAGAGQERPQGAAASTGSGLVGRSEDVASAAPQGRGGGADDAGMAGRSSLPSQESRTLSARERAKRVHERRKTKSKYITIRFDPCNLESRYSESEIRKMIASGEVIEYTTPWREKFPS